MVMPNGLSANLFGLVDGGCHDSAMLAIVSFRKGTQQRGEPQRGLELTRLAESEYPCVHPLSCLER